MLGELTITFKIPNPLDIMQMITSITLAMGLVSGLVGAAAVDKRVVNSHVYATFYDDVRIAFERPMRGPLLTSIQTLCTANGGTAVDVNNPGCLAETGRNSVYLQAGDIGGGAKLVASPDGACGCQNFCSVVGMGNNAGCLNLQDFGYPAAGSYRFIDAATNDNTCEANNC